MTTGARVWERSKQYPVADSEVLLHQNLRRWIETMKPPGRARGLPQRIEAGPARLGFLTTTPVPGFPALSETRVTLWLDGETLMLRLEALTPDGQTAAREVRPLARNVKTARLRYYHRDPTNPQGQWHPTWTNQRKLPHLIELETTSPTPMRMVVAPRLE